MKVRDIMTQPVVAVKPETTLAEIAQTMLTHHINGVVVVDAQGKLCGIVTTSDFSAKEAGVPFSALKLPQIFHQWVPREGIERIFQSARELTAREIMSTEVWTLTEDQTVEQAVQLMLKHDVNRVPVVRNAIPVGMVSRRDLLKLLASQLAP